MKKEVPWASHGNPTIQDGSRNGLRLDTVVWDVENNFAGFSGLYSVTETERARRSVPEIRRSPHLSSSTGFARPASFMISLPLVVTVLLALLIFPGDGFAMQGSFYQSQLAAEQKKCKAIKGNSKKAKKKRATCSKGVKGRAESATRKAMATTDGFYGFNLKPNQIPDKNGTLIWSKQETGEKNSPDASSTHNVLYSSKSFPGERKTVVSGTVMIPKGAAPAGGWPVISWAHGTVGLADQCAPSRRLGDTDYYGSESGELIGSWLRAGYAVVATDYEGLGTPGIHPYLIGNSEGRGVLDIVQAGRQLNGSISKRVVLAGHSQGGQAILFAANLATTPWGSGSSYLGTVAYAPVSNLVLQAPIIGSFDDTPGQYGISALALSILRGAVAGDPDINPNNLLTEGGRELYPETDEVCLGELTQQAQAAGIKPGQLLSPGWANTPDGRLFNDQLVAMNPDVRVGAPVLIPQGEADGTVVPLYTVGLVDQLRLTNPTPADRIAYETFPGATHSSILLDSEPEVAEFIAGRFSSP